MWRAFPDAPAGYMERERTAGKNVRRDAETWSSAKGSPGTRRAVVTANTVHSSLLIVER